MNIVEREGELWRKEQGTGDPTSQGRVHRSPEPPGALFRILIKFDFTNATDRREETSLLSAAIWEVKIL